MIVIKKMNQKMGKKQIKISFVKWNKMIIKGQKKIRKGKEWKMQVLKQKPIPMQDQFLNLIPKKKKRNKK